MTAGLLSRLLPLIKLPVKAVGRYNIDIRPGYSAVYLLFAWVSEQFKCSFKES